MLSEGKKGRLGLLQVGKSGRANSEPGRSHYKLVHLPHTEGPDRSVIHIVVRPRLSAAQALCQLCDWATRPAQSAFARLTLSASSASSLSLPLPTSSPGNGRFLVISVGAAVKLAGVLDVDGTGFEAVVASKVGFNGAERGGREEGVAGVALAAAAGFFLTITPGGRPFSLGLALDFGRVDEEEEGVGLEEPGRPTRDGGGEGSRCCALEGRNTTKGRVRAMEKGRETRGARDVLSERVQDVLLLLALGRLSLLMLTLRRLEEVDLLAVESSELIAHLHLLVPLLSLDILKARKLGVESGSERVLNVALRL